MRTNIERAPFLTVDIECDDCEKLLHLEIRFLTGYPEEERIEEYLRKNGWVQNKEHDKHRCPKCRAKKGDTWEGLE